MRRAAEGLLATALLWPALAACGTDAPFRCQRHEQCVLDGAAGRCEGDGFCSFADDSCPSKRRYGEHAVSPQANSCVPLCISEVALGDKHGCLRREDGTLMCWGDTLAFKLGPGVSGEGPLPPTQLAGIRTASGLGAGSNHTCAIIGATRRIVCWGENLGGQLGSMQLVSTPNPVTVAVDGIKDLQAVQVLGGLNHTCARTDYLPNTAICWGDNSRCQLGGGNCTPNMGPQLVPTAPVTVTAPNALGSLRELAIAGNSSCARLDNGIAACWGNNQADQLCTGPVVVASSVKLPPDGVSSVGVSGAISCTAVGSALSCCGEAAAGWGTLDFPGVISDIAVGDDYVCALADGRVLCAGDNQLGQLGQGHSDAETGLVEVAALPPISQLVSGGSSSCALSEGGVVYCWGANDLGQVDPYAPSPFVASPSDALTREVSCTASE